MGNYILVNKLSIPLILASASEARTELLAAAGFSFKRVRPEVKEPAPDQGESLQRYVIRLARLKAEAIAASRSYACVLAADTALCLPPTRPTRGRLRVIGKPEGENNDDRAAAAGRMLTKLAGREHCICTGICLIAPGKTGCRWRTRTGSVTARVRLRLLTTDEIREYVRRTRPWHCAGAYALQGAGAAIIADIRGDPTTIIGLPMVLTTKILGDYYNT